MIFGLIDVGFTDELEGSSYVLGVLVHDVAEWPVRYSLEVEDVLG